MKKYPQMKQICQTSRAQKSHAIWYGHDLVFGNDYHCSAPKIRQGIHGQIRFPFRLSGM